MYACAAARGTSSGPSRCNAARTRDSTASRECRLSSMPIELFRVLANEVVEPRNAVLDGRVRCGIREADVLSVSRHAPAKVNVGENGYARLVQQTLAERLRIGGSDALARLRHVRPRVERATRALARDAGHVVQEANNQVAAREKMRVHVVDCILWSVDRLDGGPLRNLRRARFGVRDPAREHRRERAVRDVAEP